MGIPLILLLILQHMGIAYFGGQMHIELCTLEEAMLG
jgi:hypothetical protein